MRSHEVFQVNRERFTAMLRGSGYSVLFTAEIHLGEASVSIAVGHNDDHARGVDSWMKFGERDLYPITGNGSISALRHVKDFLMGDFLDYCKELYLASIKCCPADERRKRAYRWLCKLGFYFLGTSYHFDIPYADDDQVMHCCSCKKPVEYNYFPQDPTAEGICFECAKGYEPDGDDDLPF